MPDKAELREISHGIFMITEKGAFGGFKPDVNIFVLAGSDGLVYDAGYGTKRSVKNFIARFREIERICASRGEPFSVKRILISHAHPDHFSGLARMRRELGLSVIVTERMAGHIGSRETYRQHYAMGDAGTGLVKLPAHRDLFFRALSPLLSFLYERLYGMAFVPDPDVIIEENATIAINGEPWQIFLSPGHSDDHISLYSPSRGVLFSGDNILDSIITWLGPPRSDLGRYIESLERYLTLPLTTVLGAHGEPVQNPKERIRFLLTWRAKRTEDLLSAVRGAGLRGVTVPEIAAALYENGSWLRRWFAQGWILVTLAHLIGTGAVKREPVAGEIRLFAS